MTSAIGAVPKLLLCLILSGIVATLNAQTRVESEYTRHIKSRHSVELTVERAKRITEHNGFKVFGVIDYAKNATDIDMKLLPAQLLVFGNPVVATELMNANPLIGLDLPLKLLVWEDRNGVIWISYSPAEFLRKRHKLDEYSAQFSDTERLLKDLAQEAGR